MVERLEYILCSWGIAMLGLTLVPLGAGAADAPAQLTFANPAEAMHVLIAAARSNDQPALISILGPGSEDIVSSGDPVEDRNAGKRVAAAADERIHLETLPNHAVIAVLGRDHWPLPIPLVKDAGRWRFDTPAARDELLNRRIGRNELRAAAVCRASVEAQREYARTNRAGGVNAYAQRVASTPGNRDGLYWEDPDGKHPSPLGPLVAEATAEGYRKPEAGSAQPYHGYLYRILTAQGPHAPGGQRSYVKDGQMTGGFAFIAYPADHGASGVMTFIVGPEGVVYQKNLGSQTTEIATAMTTYDPDDSWSPVRD